MENVFGKLNGLWKRVKVPIFIEEKFLRETEESVWEEKKTKEE